MILLIRLGLNSLSCYDIESLNFFASRLFFQKFYLMKAYSANLINSIALIALALWGYFGSDTPSFTALIPVAAGIVLFVLGFGIKKENKAVAHIVVIFTFLLLISFYKPLSGAIGREDQAAILRVVVMITTTLFALIAFVKSFIDARRNQS